MKDLVKLNNARKKIESRFKGLPYESASLVKSLITIADPCTGMVTGLTWHDVSLLLEVEKRPGRKNSGIPSKEQTREYINTILKQCSDDFRMATVGQNLQFQFINMPAIYAQFFTEETQSHTVNPIDCPIATSLENTDSIDDFDTLFDREFPIEHPTPDTPVKNNNIYIINKQTNITREEVGDKKLIADDFYPNAETISEASSLGFTKATDADEIREFIKKNKKWGRQFADFNPVFLEWLKRDFNPHGRSKPVNNNQQPGNHLEHSSHQAHTDKPTLADLKKRNREIIDQAEGRCSPGVVIEGEYSSSVASFG